MGEKQLVDEIAGHLKLYSDGSVQRPASSPDLPAGQIHFQHEVDTKDILIDPDTGVKARIFLPHHLKPANVNNKEVPIVLHFHGGGWCTCRPSNPDIHHFCSHMALKMGWIWISVYYRLAPEHRLPTAYDDCYNALDWLRLHAQGDGHEPWLLDHADFSRCYMIGGSSGGGNVHHVAMRASIQGSDYWQPLRVRGLLMLHPGILPRKPNFNSIPNGTPTSGKDCDTIITLALPPGASYGHPLLNPMSPDASPKLTEVSLPPSLVAVAEKDFLYECNMEYFEALKNAGHNVELLFTPHKGHVFYLKEMGKPEGDDFENRLISFMNSVQDS